jgi:hypothetical protein
VPTFEVASAYPTQVQADLLILPLFEGRVPGPGVEVVQEALGADPIDPTRGPRGDQDRPHDPKNLKQVLPRTQEGAGPRSARDAGRPSRSFSRVGSTSDCLVPKTQCARTQCAGQDSNLRPAA